MLNDIDVALYDEPIATVQDILEDWSSSEVDLDLDTVVVEVGGRIVGYVSLVKAVSPELQRAYGGVHPDHIGRGIGSFLVDWSERRALERSGRPKTTLRHWIEVADEGALELVERRGYRFARRFWNMWRALDESLEDPPAIEGVTIRPFQRGRDERATHDVFQSAFRNHWGFTPESYEEGASARWEAEWFRPDLSFVAAAGDEAVGASINSERLGDGFVDDLAVLEEWRGRGIAEALLRTSFRLFKERGFARAGLMVDSDNSTGAVRLYERVGMKAHQSLVVYDRKLP